MVRILIPGRWHLTSEWLHKYLQGFVQKGLFRELDIDGIPLGNDRHEDGFSPINELDKIESLDFIVTSSNRDHTRLNPFSAGRRHELLVDFASDLGVPFRIYDVDHQGYIPDFASYVRKNVEWEIGDEVSLRPGKAIVLCSTPSYKMWEKLGYRILPAELAKKEPHAYRAAICWEILAKHARSEKPMNEDEEFLAAAHISTWRLFQKYGLSQLVKELFSDPITTDEGELTKTRNDKVYLKQMDAKMKYVYAEVARHIRPGNIGDLGCANGSFLKLLSEDRNLSPESVLFGMDISAEKYRICRQRLKDGDFATTDIFFSMGNAVREPLFKGKRMHTIFTGSITHEIESYTNELEHVMSRIANALLPGGIWVNRDVIGPENKDEIIYVRCNKDNGRNDDYERQIAVSSELKAYLEGMSTYARFLRFCQDFRKQYGYKVQYEAARVEGKDYFIVKMRDACDFSSKFTYTDNWQSEVGNETFCARSFTDYVKLCEKLGLRVLPQSHTYRNEFVYQNLIGAKTNIRFYRMEQGKLVEFEHPHTHMLLLAEKVGGI